MQLTFTIEQLAIDANKRIWINCVRSAFAKDKQMVGTGTKEFDTLDDLTDDEIAALKVYGLKEGAICKLFGVTENYAQVKKAYEVEEWYFIEPELSLMTNVTGYQEKPFNPNWEPPIDVAIN